MPVINLPFPVLKIQHGNFFQIGVRGPEITAASVRIPGPVFFQLTAIHGHNTIEYALCHKFPVFFHPVLKQGNRCHNQHRCHVPAAIGFLQC